MEIRIYDEQFSISNLVTNSTPKAKAEVKREISGELLGAPGDSKSLPRSIVDTRSLPRSFLQHRDYSGGSITDKQQPPMPISTALLNRNLDNLNLPEVKKRRSIYNFVYQEIISFEEPGKGLPFEKVLKVLSYQLIDAERFLK